MKKKFYLIILIVLLLLINLYSFSKLTIIKEKTSKPEHYLKLPPGKYLRVLSLDNKEIAGDILLSRALTYYGSHYYNKKYKYPYLYDFFKNVCEIDSYNLQAILMGGRLLSDKYPHKATKLLISGEKYLPQSWKIPELTGFIYYYNVKDRHLAAKYYEIASKKPSHPPYIPSLSSKFYSETGELEDAIKVLYSFYSTTKDKRLKKSFKQDMDKLSAELYLRKRWRKATVERVIDGDSLIIRTESGYLKEARIIGINSYELNSPSEEYRIYGRIGKDFAYYTLNKKSVHFTIGGDGVDRYGRVLIYLWYDNTKLYNEEILKRGFAKAFLRYSFNKAMKKRFKEAEEFAKVNMRGLWGIKYLKPIEDLSYMKAIIGNIAKVRFRVYNVYFGRKDIFINSSYDYKHSFKLLIPSKFKMNFYPEILKLQGKRIESFGFVSQYKGVPEIRVYEKSQIKVIK